MIQAAHKVAFLIISVDSILSLSRCIPSPSQGADSPVVFKDGRPYLSVKVGERIIFIAVRLCLILLFLTGNDDSREGDWSNSKVGGNLVAF